MAKTGRSRDLRIGRLVVVLRMARRRERFMELFMNIERWGSNHLIAIRAIVISRAIRVNSEVGPIRPSLGSDTGPTWPRSVEIPVAVGILVRLSTACTIANTWLTSSNGYEVLYIDTYQSWSVCTGTS